MGGFEPGERLWTERLGSLRNTVRQALIARQLSDHVRPGFLVLDVGCGQGSQALQLARAGCAVTGIDPSEDLLERAAADAERTGVDIELLRGELDGLPELLAARVFDLVCAHGVLMYLDDEAAALVALADRVGPRGLLSITFRNRDALAFRPGMRGDWTATLEAFDRDTYVNELGLPARAHRLDDLAGRVDGLGFDVVAWYGVRVFTDPVAATQPLPEGDLDTLLEAEWRAGTQDPYRRLGSQIHMVARRR